MLKTEQGTGGSYSEFNFERAATFCVTKISAVTIGFTIFSSVGSFNRDSTRNSTSIDSTSFNRDSTSNEQTRKVNSIDEFNKQNRSV